MLVDRIRRFIALFAQGMIQGAVMNACGGDIYINNAIN